LRHLSRKLEKQGDDIVRYEPGKDTGSDIGIDFREDGRPEDLISEIVTAEPAVFDDTAAPEEPQRELERRKERPRRGPIGDERFASYIMSGTLGDVGPLRGERSTQRRRAFFAVFLLLLVVAIVLYFIFFKGS
jgi:hypothetical protein